MIRGVGVSNDGRGNGFLAPSSAGQVRAMESAYAMSGIRPHEISLVECHATGTTVGDATELQSMDAVFKDNPQLHIGSLKSNMGHAITAAGIAGLLKVLGAMESKTLPPVINEKNSLGQTRFNLVTEAANWTAEVRRKAAISAFGFGGNNAHMIVEEYVAPGQIQVTAARTKAAPLAVVGMGAVLGQAGDLSEVSASSLPVHPMAAGRKPSRCP